MNQLQIFQAQLRDIPAVSDQGAVEHLVSVYLVARESIDELIDVQATAKRQLRAVIERTGVGQWQTPAGSVITPADATIISYDASALDRLAALSPVFRRKVYPFRTETFRAGGIRILPNRT